jgi:MPBQ/MSBQ methyltransferase
MILDLRSSPYEPDEVDELVDYLHRIYANVFTVEAIRTHLENHVGYAFSDYATAVVAPNLPKGAKLLDIGCGFGSTVVAAREAGLDARGIEIAAFEVEFARRRLARVRPQDNPAEVFLLGDATKIDLPEASLDAVSFWNVLEHIEDCRAILAAAWRFLKPGGLAYIMCPNYAASRDEAHYHVPWKPELRHDRAQAAAYIRDCGRDPTYFETSIFCRTNQEVLGLLGGLGFEPLDIASLESRALSLRNVPAMLRQRKAFLEFHSPSRHSVTLAARKPLR